MPGSGAASPGPDVQLPAWAQESSVLRLDSVASTEAMDHAWAFGGATGAGMRVAVIDSGVEADHPGLEGCVERDAGVEVVLDEQEAVEVRTGPHGDAFGHGTACAGIIHSLAPAASIVSVKVLGEGLRAKMAGFFAGLEWAVDQRFDVINLSLGGSRRDWALPFHELCDRAYFQGSFVVTAANNVKRASYPSLYASVTSVATNLSQDPWRFHFNPDPPTEFLARGVDVPVLWNHGGTSEGTGNSYAAPHIAGLATLIRSKHPSLRPFQLKAALWAVAGNVADARENMAAGRLTGVARTSLMASRVLPRQTTAAPATPPPVEARVATVAPDGVKVVRPIRRDT